MHRDYRARQLNFLYLSGVLLFGSGVFDFDERTFLRGLEGLLLPRVLLLSALFIASRILLRIRGSLSFLSSMIMPLFDDLLMIEVETPVARS